MFVCINRILRFLKEDIWELYTLVVSDLDSVHWIGRYEPPKLALARVQWLRPRNSMGTKKVMEGLTQTPAAGRYDFTHTRPLKSICVNMLADDIRVELRMYRLNQIRVQILGYDRGCFTRAHLPSHPSARIHRGRVHRAREYRSQNGLLPRLLHPIPSRRPWPLDTWVPRQGLLQCFFFSRNVS